MSIFLELFIADFIILGHKDLFVIIKFDDVKILKPSKFLQEISQ